MIQQINNMVQQLEAKTAIEAKTTIQLEAKEVRDLLRLLESHIYFGWVGLVGEFEVEASWEASPILEKLYWRVKKAARQ